MSDDSAERSWGKAIGTDPKQLDMFFEKMIDGFAYHKIVLDEVGKPVDYIFLEVNDAFERMTGLNRGRIVGRRATEVVKDIKNDPSDWIGVYGRVALTGQGVDFENFAERLGKWFRVSAYCPEKGYFVALFEDITERKKAEEEILLARNEWERTFDSIPDLIAILDTQYRIVRVNKAMAQRLGVNASQCIGLNCFRCVHKLDSPPPFCPLSQTVADGKEHVAEVHEDNLGGDFIESATPLFDQQGRVIGLIHVARDITQRKKTEEEVLSVSRFPAENPNPVLRISIDGKILYSNDAGSTLLNEWKSEVGMVAPARWRQIITEVYKSGTRNEFEEKYGTRTFLMMLSPVREGGYVNIYGRDITKRKIVEQALRDSQIDLNRAQAVAKTGSWRLNVQRNELLWSDETYRMFGIPKGSPLTYETFLSYVHPDDRGYVDQKWQAALRGETYDIEHRIVVNGQVRWVREKAELEVDKDGSLLGGFGTVSDITERKQIENALRETRDYLENLLNYANAPIIVWDPEFKITRFNRAFEHMSGYKTDEVIGKNLSMLFPEETRETSLTEIQHTLAGEYWESMEIPILRKDGEVRTVLWNSANIYSQDGKTLMATIAQGIDITERKKLEHKLKTTERMATIGETAAMVGHDLRNPLQAIVGFIALADEQLAGTQCSPEEKQKIEEPLKAIGQQTRYMNKIVLDLQDYAGPLKPQLKETDLPALVNEVLSTLQVPQTIQVSIEIPLDFPRINVDPTLMTRAFTNLFRNAIEAMPQGGKLTIDAAQAHGMISINVRDTGSGIAEENMPRLFQPLFTTKAKGQGFGLPVCKQIIEAHGGSITVDSQLRKGATFTLMIPMNRSNS